jgi:hypothetical protein
MKWRRLWAIAAIMLLMIPATNDASAVSGAARLDKSEAAVKKLLLMAGLEECVSDDNSLQKNPTIGSDLSTILTSNKYVFVGPMASGNSTGYIGCQDLVKNLFNNATITDTMVGNTGLLNNVYSKQALSEKTLTCSYYIINSSANSVYKNNDGSFKRYYWPQGYYDYDPKDRTGVPKTTIVYNDNGFVRTTGTEIKGSTNDLMVDLKSTFNRLYKGSGTDMRNVCSEIIKDVPLYYEVGSPNWQGVSPSTSIRVRSTDDDKFDPFGPGSNKNKAWLKYDSSAPSDSDRRSLVHNVSTTSSATQLEKNTNSPAKTLIANTRYLLYAIGGGIDTSEFKNISPKDYLERKTDLEYVFYARYLFNGDGGMPYNSTGGGCGALAVSSTDPNFSKLPAEEWNISQPYVSKVSAYKDNSSTKSSYIASWFGAKKNKAVEIQLYPWSKDKVDCKTIAQKFNAATTTSNTLKEKVRAYMNIATVDTAGNMTTADGSTIDGSLSGSTPEDIAEATVTEAAKPTCDMGALGWILCPIVHTLDNILGKIYEWIEHSLIIPTSFMSTSTDNSTYGAWKIFRNFANIAFIILLMIVIFSQVTSVGISNYGIKKILPRLIMVGILINLSYFICQIAVDLSNILGAGLNSMLSTIIPPPETLGTKDFGFIGNVFATVGIAGAAGVVAAALTGGWALFFGLITLLLTGLVSLLMMFVALGFRQIGVVVLIAAAPLAIVCKLLPNTEKIFSSWVKMLKTLLVLYPICGALVGGGVMVGRIVAGSGSDIIGSLASIVTFGASTTTDSSTTGNIVQILAGLCVVLPYFAVFTLTKKSLEGLGTIGSAITSKLNGAQGKINSGLEGKLRKNNAFLNYKNQQRDIANTQAKGGVYKGRNPIRRLRSRINNGAIGGLRGEDYNRRLRAAGLNASLTDHSQRVKDYSTFMDDLDTGKQVYDELEKAHESGDRAGVQAGLEQLAKRNDFGLIDKFLARDHSADNEKMQSTISSELIKNKQAAPHQWAYGIDMKKTSDDNAKAREEGKEEKPVRSFSDYAQDEAGLKQAMHGLGDDALVNMDRDVLKSMKEKGFRVKNADGSEGSLRAADMFTGKQLRTAATSLSGEKLDHLKGIVKQMDGHGASLVNGISAAQLGKTKSDIFNAITSDGNDATMRSLLSQDGSTLQTAIDDLFKDQNAGMLAEMNPEVRKVLEKYRSGSAGSEEGERLDLRGGAPPQPLPQQGGALESVHASVLTESYNNPNLTAETKATLLNEAKRRLSADDDVARLQNVADTHSEQLFKDAAKSRLQEISARGHTDGSGI